MLDGNRHLVCHAFQPDHIGLGKGHVVESGDPHRPDRCAFQAERDNDHCPGRLLGKEADPLKCIARFRRCRTIGGTRLDHIPDQRIGYGNGVACYQAGFTVGRVAFQFKSFLLLVKDRDTDKISLQQLMHIFNNIGKDLIHMLELGDTAADVDQRVCPILRRLARQDLGLDRLPQSAVPLLLQCQHLPPAYRFKDIQSLDHKIGHDHRRQHTPDLDRDTGREQNALIIQPGH